MSTADGPHHPFVVTSGGARLAAERTDGEGPALVLLHAGVADRRVWRATVNALGGAFPTVSYDRRGFGETEAPPERHDPVADLVAVLDATSRSRAWLVGNSMGGLLALDATVAHPDRVQGLVLVAPAVRGMPDEDSIEPPPAILELFEQFEAAEAAADTERQNQLDARYWLDGPLEPEGRVAGEARRLFLDMNARALAAAPVGDEAEGAAVWGRLGEIAVPTLVLWGDLDEPWTGDVCRSLAGAIPGAIARELHGTAHLPGLEQPAALAAVVADFVTTHTAGGRP